MTRILFEHWPAWMHTLMYYGMGLMIVKTVHDDGKPTTYKWWRASKAFMELDLEIVNHENSLPKR